MQTVFFDSLPEKDFAPKVIRSTTTIRIEQRVTPVNWFATIPNGDFAPKVVAVPLPPITDQNWQTRAACRGQGNTPSGIAQWFPGPGGSQDGKKFCHGCPVIVECGDFADREQIEWGIWGGEIRHRRKRGEELTEATYDVA